MMLLVTPFRKAPESLLGYTLRVSEANGYDTPWHVLSMAGIKEGQMNSAGFPVEKLAAILGRAPSEMQDVAYRRENSKEYQLLGQSLGQCLVYKPLRLKAPAICPQCVKDLGYIDAFWDLNFAVACPHHHTVAIQTCQVCDENLTWFRRGLLRCKCGADFGEISPPTATPPVTELMQVLFAKVHGQVISSKPSELLPTEKLESLSLHALLDAIGALGGFATSVLGRDGPYMTCQIVSAVANTLQDWPKGYHSLLRQLDNQQDIQFVGTVSLRKRFERFYAALFKQANKKSDFKFLWDELIQFGLLEWGDGVVDRRMLTELDVAPRFVSKKELADTIGVDPRTVGKWAALGKLPLSAVSVGKSSIRYIGDLSTIQIPQEANGRYLHIREAAKLINLPVSVLRSLKRSGHYGVKHMPEIKRGFHEADLNNFALVLLGKCSLVSKETITEDALSLKHVMQEIHFWSDDGKARVIAAYLDGKIQSIGRLEDHVGSIHFAMADIKSLASRSRADASHNAISKHEAARWIGCDPLAVQRLAENGYLTAVPSLRRTSIGRESVEAFTSTYVSISGLASELGTTALKLKRLCRHLSIDVMLIAMSNVRNSAFIARETKEPLVRALNNNRLEKRPTSIELLTRYLDRLRQNGQPLPRLGRAPNRVVIAQACGFDRSAFYKNRFVVQALEKFDDEDVLRYALRPNIPPVEALRRYLEHLRQSNDSLPCLNGKPNRVAIAREAGFKRDYLYTDPALAELIEIYHSDCQQVSDGSRG